MVDAPNSPEPQPQQPEMPVAGTRPASFFASTMGRVILAVVALVVVLVVLGAIAWFFLLNSSSPQNVGMSGTVTTNSTVAKGGSATESDTAPATEPQEKPLESTFTFRNVFAPTLKAPTPASDIASATASSTSGSSSDEATVAVGKVPKNTLYLVSIQTENGKKTATFVWNNAVYTLGKGGVITGTPWKVVEIGDSSVVMLYGDTEVSLSTGQGLSK